MNPYELRMECLRLANAKGWGTAETVKMAEAYYAFTLGKPAETTAPPKRAKK